VLLETKKGGVESPKAEGTVKSLAGNHHGFRHCDMPWTDRCGYHYAGGLLFLCGSHSGLICVRDEEDWYHRQLSPAAIEIYFDIVSIDVVAIFLEKNCLAKGKLSSVVFYKSFDPGSVDLFASARV
jgi:hypothetical protein